MKFHILVFAALFVGSIANAGQSTTCRLQYKDKSLAFEANYLRVLFNDDGTARVQILEQKFMSEDESVLRYTQPLALQSSTEKEQIYANSKWQIRLYKTIAAEAELSIMKSNGPEIFARGIGCLK